MVISLKKQDNHVEIMPLSLNIIKEKLLLGIGSRSVPTSVPPKGQAGDLQVQKSWKTCLSTYITILS